MQVVVDNLLTSYELKGKGQLVLLLHGWGDSKETFKQLQAELSKDKQVVALDLPGFGQTQIPSEVWSLDNYAKFVNSFLSKLELPEPSAIIGHSNGGALAIRGLSSGDLKSKTLILLASSGIRTGNTFKKTVIKIVAKVGKVVTFWLPEVQRKNLRKKLYGVAGSDMLVAPHLQETFKVTVRQDIQQDAKQLKLPTLLIYAEGDRAVPLADGRKLHDLIKRSELVVVPDADHFVHHTATEQVNKSIQEFLSENL